MQTVCEEKEKQQLLRRLQLVELNLLQEFDKVCKKHKLTYWIAFGTVLGAVRHQGFIPWDDDIDVCMPMEDYKKFLAVASNRLPEYIHLYYEKKDNNYNKHFAKIMDLRTTLIEYHDSLCDYEFRGIYMDIFPVIAYPKISDRLCRRLTLLMCNLEFQRTCFQRITLKNIYRWLKITAKEYLLRFFWAILALRKSDDIELLPYDNGYGVKYNKNIIFPLKPLLFEGNYFPGPQNPDQYLKTLYGNYMELPPLEKRRIHALFFDTENSYPHPLGFKKQ